MLSDNQVTKMHALFAPHPNGLTKPNTRMINQSIKVLKSQLIISRLIANYLFFLEFSSSFELNGRLGEGI